ncbi:hypothetical protein HDU76_002149, partial [Blyttiomyces sp. JEL0837]
MSVPTAPGVSILGAVPAQYADILSIPAQEFVASLHRSFNARRKALLQRRVQRQKAIDAGQLPDFLPETKWIRDDPTWRAAPPAPGLIDRRVEITGPVDRKMVINALNSGASTFMADFEDSNAPTWENNLSGQANLRDAVNRTISYAAPGPNGKFYKLKEGKLATLIVRPRGWHMEEKHFLIDGEPASASIFDFALYFFHNARQSLKIGAGPYFYLPKMESHLEAREHSSGLNCGRWDYIFSYIKRLRNHSAYVLPDRGDVTMTSPFMDSYVRLLIKTCHKRGVHAMGGMAAQIPIRDNVAANEVAMTKVRNDKLREVKAGHDGTWVAHPDLVKIALAIFNEHMPQPNQLFVRREDVNVTANDLLSTNGVKGAVTEKGVRNNLNVALQYMESWLRGLGCVPIHNLMEDAATAEISRSQLWQWVRHRAQTAEGKTVTNEWMTQLLDEEVAAIRSQIGEAKFAASKFEQAKKFLAGTIRGDDNYAEFLTTLCYDQILSIKSGSAK